MKGYEYKAEEILEEYASAYSQVDKERLARKLELIAKSEAKNVLDKVLDLIKNAESKSFILGNNNDSYRKGYENSIKHFKESVCKILEEL